MTDRLEQADSMATQSGEIKGTGCVLSYTAVTDRGLVRACNEDGFLVIEKEAIFCIADGAGGHKRGDVASSLTLKGISDVVKGLENKTFDDTIPVEEKTVRLTDIPEGRQETILIPAIHHANEVCRTAEVDNLVSTIVACHFTGDHVHIAHVGDSRVYCLETDSLNQLTDDHSLVNYLYRQGSISKEERSTHPKRNVILKAIGVEDHVEISLTTRRLRSKTLYLLCSDGLTSMVADQEIEAIVTSGTTPESICTDLLQAAKKAGGRDNITIIIIKVE